MKQNFKKILCTALASAMLLSGTVSVMAEGEETQSVDPVLNLDIASYKGFMTDGTTLKDTVSGKAVQTTNGTNTTMTGINYGIYKEEQNGTPYLYVDGMAKLTGLERTDITNQMSVEMWIALDENIPQNMSNIYRLYDSEGKTTALCFKTGQKLKFSGQNTGKGNDKYSCAAYTGWNHVVVTQFLDENSMVNTNLYVNGESVGTTQTAIAYYNDSKGSDETYRTGLNTLTLGGHVNQTYNLITENANKLGGNSKFYLGEFKIYNTCLDGAVLDASNIKPLYNEDSEKYNFTPAKANVADDGAVIDLDMSGDGVTNKINLNDTVKPASGEGFTKGYINTPDKAVPYITVTEENKGYIIDSARFERLPEQTYEMWIRLKESYLNDTLIAVGDDSFSKYASFQVNDYNYAQVNSAFKGTSSGLLYGSAYSWFDEEGQNNDEWIHVVVSRYLAMENDKLLANDANAKYYSAVYINGKPLSEVVYNGSNAGTYTQSVINNLKNICIGGVKGGYVGLMDVAKFKVYDRFMKPTEVKSIYDSEKDTFKNNYSSDFELLKVEPLDLQLAQQIYVRSAEPKYENSFADNRGGKLNVTFSTPVNAKSLTEDSITILKDGKEIVGGVSILGLSEQGYCVNLAYGALDVSDETNKAKYTLRVNGLQNLNGNILYDEMIFTVQDNKTVFSAEDMDVKADATVAKKNYLIEYTVDAAILDVKPFDGKTIEVTTNYDITDFDAIAVTITGMEIVSADYADRTVTITTTEDFVAGSEHTVTIDGKTATFTATEKPAAVEVGEVKYTDASGNAIADKNNITGTTAINASVDIVVRDDTDVSLQDFNVIMAVYDDDNNLVAVDLKKSNMDISNGVQTFNTFADKLKTKQTYRVEMKLVDLDNDSSVLKTFVWDNGLKPLCSVK